MPEQKTLSQFNKDMYDGLFGNNVDDINPLDGKVPDFVLGDPLGLFGTTTGSTKVAIAKRSKK